MKFGLHNTLYPIDNTECCIYALFINHKHWIKKNCFLKTLNRTTNLTYSFDGYLWAISALATEKLQVRCVMETHVITIQPPSTNCGHLQWMQSLLSQHLHTS